MTEAIVSEAGRCFATDKRKIVKKISTLQSASSLRFEWVFGFLALACGAADEGSGAAQPIAPSTPGMLNPPTPEMTPEAPAPVDVAPTEGTPTDVALDGEQTPPAGPTAEDPAPVEPPSMLPILPDGVQPVTPNAIPQVRNLLAFLYQEYGVHMLSGQMESTWMQGGAEYELNYIEELTGKLPAVRGLDFIEYDGVAQRTIDWWERGGIANVRWHWGAPTHGQGYDASQEAVDIDRVLTPGTAEYTSMIDGLDRTAEELAIIRDANVPVLWTPFHELNGNWFWWGKEGPDQFKRLWQFMFDYFTEEKGLTNLIWVLGYTGQPNAAWFPGKEYVDIAGADSYQRTEQPALNMFNAVRNIVGMQMPVAYHENGIIPNPTLAREQGATWSWFMTWHTNWLTNQNTPQHVQDAYADDFVLTLDELPSLR
jgi:Glycosyl hydrolase family 26